MVTILQVFILLGISASVGAGLAMFISLSSVLPKVSDMEAPEATIIYSSDGVILGRIFREDRTNVPLKDIPKSLRDATVAIEDSRFYHHSGVDMKGITRAVWANVRGQRLSQGGSTITQQLARNVYLTQRKTVERKAQEAVLAILMERHFSKDKILELYLNQVYYGSGAFGVQAASKVYFGKDVDKITVAEAALLAGMPQKPSGYSPHEDPKAALGRRNMVLKRMVGLGYISQGEWQKAREEELDIVPREKGRSTYKAAHFVDFVTRKLRDRYGDDVLFSGGLRVYTTLNYEMQKTAETALRQGVRKYEKTRRVSEGCFVAVEPTTGYIRAMVGSVDPKSHFNRCTQGKGRQPGSAFKAFVYATAFEKARMTPETQIVDGFVSYPQSFGKPWTPKNYDNRWHGTVTIKQAVARSINIPAIKVAEKVGVKNIIEYAYAMGIKADLEPYLPLAIGGIKGVHPIDMASAYGTFANGGVHVEPLSVVRVTNSRGDIIEDFVPEGKPVLSQRSNAMIDECLRAVVTASGGTGYVVRDIPEARGKTGTTNEDRDAWFIGYIPGKLVAACWVGNDDYAPMRKAYGGLVCAPVWREFMQKAVPLLDKIRKAEEEKRQGGRREPVVKTDKSDVEERRRRSAEESDRDAEADVTAADEPEAAEYSICSESNLLATDNCPSTHRTRFVRGTQPTSYCSIHGRDVSSGQRDRDRERSGESSEVTLVTVTVCPDSGLLAGPECPSRTRKRVPIDEVPTQVCNQHVRGQNR